VVPASVTTPAPRPTQVAHAPPPALATVAAPADATAVAHLNSLLFPVANRDSARLADSFEDDRDGGARKHRAIDIMAPKGTPVLAVADGRVLRLANTSKGGISLYSADLEEQFVYYYAHLDRYHPAAYAGRPVLRGDTLGYVGTTGNAAGTAPHLHFQLMRMPADRKYWNGEPINPYPLLRAAEAPSGKAGP
jgi:murein DD-endopeptidase MepM/ murein hydrolase activator NlpD